MFPFKKSSLLGVQAERSVLISQQVRVDASELLRFLTE